MQLSRGDSIAIAVLDVQTPVMGKRAIIFHGTGGHPSYIWYTWLGERLRARDFEVELPHHPGLNVEPIATFLPKVLAAHRFDSDTVLVGHSGGAALLLSILEQIAKPVAQAILVAGYFTEPNTEPEPVLQASYDWAKIKSAARELYFINSITDPYGCDERQGRGMLERLGGTLIIRDEGHFGGEGQPYPTFPLLERLIA